MASTRQPDDRSHGNGVSHVIPGHHHPVHVHEHDSEGHGHEAQPFTRIYQILQPERRDIGAILLFSFAVAILSLASPIAVETLVNTVAFGVLVWPIVVIAGVLMMCLGLAAAIRAMQVYVVENIQRRMFVRVVADYANRIPQMQLDGLDRSYGPELGNRFFDLFNVQKCVASLLLDGIAIIITAGVGMVVLAFYHPFLLGFDIVLMVMIAFLLFGLGIGGVTTSMEESHCKYDMAAWLEELLRAMRVFKFAGGPKFALQKADELAVSFLDARKAHFRVVMRQTVFALGMQVVASTALLGLGGWLVIHQQLTLGQLVASELIVSLIVASVAKLGKYAELFYDMLAGAEKLSLFIDMPLERSGGEELPANGQGMAVRLRGVRHPAIHDGELLLNEDIRANERVVVSGPPGSGKSTLFEVMCGLRPTETGYVEINNIDIRALALEKLREDIIFLSGSELFLGTVMENVRMGREHLSIGDVREALGIVGLVEVIHELPNGFDTQLMPNGDPLSANQAIRLTLARALVGRPRLLILDGLLDGLDLRDCPKLLPKLFDPAAPWTLMISTTKPEIIQMCDRVVELIAPHTDIPPASGNMLTGGSHG